MQHSCPLCGAVTASTRIRRRAGGRYRWESLGVGDTMMVPIPSPDEEPKYRGTGWPNGVERVSAAARSWAQNRSGVRFTVRHHIKGKKHYAIVKREA